MSSMCIILLMEASLNVNIESILSVQYNLMHGFTEDLEEHRTFGAFLGSTSSGKNEHFYDICNLQGF